MADRRGVVRLITRLNVGGPARQALLLTAALAEDHPTYLAAGRPTASEGELLDPAVAVHYVPLVRSLDVRQDAAAFVAVRRLLRDRRPAILHTHMAKAGTIGRLAARSLGRGIRTVHTFHGHVLEGYFSRPVTRGFLEVERALARTTDVLVAISPEIRDLLLELRIGRPAQYRVIRLGFDLGEHRAVAGPTGTLHRELGLAPTTPLVGIVGRLVPIKDHGTALRAIAALPDVHLAVVGDGELRAEVERLTDELGIRARVHFLGWRFDIPALMADLDVVLLTSRNEGTPVSLIEAGACGRAVVATDVGGVRSVVAPGATGLLVPAGDPPAVTAALRALVDDPDRRSGMGAAARLATAGFSDDRLVGEIRALYAELTAP